MTTGVAEKVLLTEEWWKADEYQAGNLEVAGQSRLDASGKKLLEEISQRAEKGLLELPPMPKAALDAMKAIKVAEPDLAAVAKAIQLDPVLVASVLRQANSALYGARAVIDTVTQAVSYLGCRRMKDIILSAAMRRATGDVRAKSYSEMEWRYAITCASLARVLGQRLGLDQEQCYVAGLLHDIGRIPVLMALEGKNALVSPPAADSPTDIILESLHRGVGLQVAEKWDQPPAVRDAVQSHLTGRRADEESLSQFPSTRVAECAGDLCVALGIGRFRRHFAIFDTPSFKELGLARSDIEDFLSVDVPKVVADVGTVL